MYSQNDEEKVIRQFFGNHVGKFLDIGAFDGKQFSNTRHLAELGWDGMLIEPDYRNFAKLVEDFPNRGGCKFIQAAVSSVSSISRLFMDDHPDRRWASSIQACLVGQSITQVSQLDIRVPTITLHQIAEIECAFDFISIDAEWEDYHLLESFPTAMRDRCRLLSIEPKNLQERAMMIRLLDRYGFSVYHETPENILANKR